MNISLSPQLPSLQNMPSLDVKLSQEQYPSQDLLQEFQKCDKLFSDYEFTKTTLKCNQLMKRYKLIPDDSISIKKLTAFSYFQCNFFYKSISIYVELVKTFHDTEAKIYLSLFEKSACLNNLVQDIKQFQGLKQESLTDIGSGHFYNDDENSHSSTNTSLHSIDSSHSSFDSSNHGCHYIFKPETPFSILVKLSNIISKVKNILEVEKQLIEFVDTLQDCYLIQIVLMVLVLEYFTIKETNKAIKILKILLSKYPNNPKYKTSVAQIYVQFGDIKNFELALNNMVNIELTDFKQNILFGVEGLFVKNHPLFNEQFLKLIALYLPQLFQEENKSAFTVQALQNIFPYYRRNIIEMMKITAYTKFISGELFYSPNNIYIDLYFD